MTKENNADRLSKLEILFCEQEYTIETLNSIVTQQNLDIKQLTGQLELFKHQLQDLKKQLPEDIIVDERPPHY